MTHPMQNHPHDDPHATPDTPGAVHDPVCGHWIVPDMAHGKSTIDGKTIHFCSTNCKRAFDAAPARFLPRLQESPPRANAIPPAATSRGMGFLDKIRPATPAGKVQDPVCHMNIDAAKAAGKSEHAGQTYYFCSAGCKKKFDAEPAKFLSGGGGAHHMH